MHQHNQRRYLVLIFGVTLTSIMANTVIAPLIPDILDAFGRPDGAGGLLISAATLPGIFAAPIGGLAADRFGRRAVLIPSLALFGLFGIAAALAPSFATLLAARFGMGLGTAALINLSIVLIADRFDGAARTRLIGINAGVLTLGLAVFPLMGGTLASLSGWRVGLGLYALGLPMAIFAWLTLDAGPRTVTGEPLSVQLREARGVLSQPLLVANFASGALAFSLIFGVFLGSVPIRLEATFGLSAFWRGAILAVPALSSSLTAFNLQRLHHRFTRINVMLVSAVLWVVAFVLMGAVPWLVMFLIGTVLYGLGEGGLIPSLQSAALDRAPEQHRAVVLAVWTSAARFGQTAGPLIAGALIGIRQGGGAILAGAVGAAVLVTIVTAVRATTQRSS